MSHTSQSEFLKGAVFALILFSVIAARGQAARGGGAAMVYRDKVEPHWFAGTDKATNRFWYRVETAKDRHEFVLVRAAEGDRGPAFDHGKAAEALAKLTGHNVEADRLPVTTLEYAADGRSVLLKGTGTNWSLDLQSYALTPQAGEGGEERRLPATRQPHPSRAGGAETEVTFVNRIDGEVNLFWIDSDGKRLPYGSLKPGESRRQHTFAGHVWLVTRSGGAILAVFEAEAESGAAVVDGREPAAGRGGRGRRGGEGPRRELAPARPDTSSPDGQWEATVHGHDLYLRDLSTGKETPLTFDANPNSTYSRSEEADRAIEMNYATRDPAFPTPEVFWSPDSRKLVAMRLRPGTTRRVYLVQSSPEDQLQPKLDSYPYLKPGDDVPVRKPHLFDIESRKEIPVKDDLFENPWSISDLRWDTNSARFTFLFNQRGHQALRLIAVNGRTGAAKPLVEEQSRTFICYSGKFFSEYLEGSGEIIWMSERDGWNHLSDLTKTAS
jgi:hypothetical protein